MTVTGAGRRLSMRALCAALLAACAFIATAAFAAERLRIEGIDGELKRNVESYIGPREETDRMSMRALSHHVAEQARNALQALGYYRPRITVAIERDGQLCRLGVDPGEPVRIRNVEVRFEGSEPPRELTDYVEASAPRQGDVLHHGKYASFKTGLLQQALMRGHFKAAWTTQQVRVDTDANIADIALVMATGPRYRVGELAINGEGLSPGLVARFPRFRAGDPYDAAKIAELHRDLTRSGWFESVQLRAEPEDAVDLVVPVRLTYTLRKRNRVGLGAGASTDEGPRVQLQWEKPWVNEKGHSLATYAEASTVRSQFEASYVVPLTDPVNSQFAWTYGLQYEDLNDHTYWLTTAGIEHRKRLPSHWRVIRALTLEQETDDFITFQTRNTLLTPGVTFTRTESEGGTLVREGWRFTGEIRGAADALGSDADMLRVTADTKGIASLGNNVRVIARAGLGALSTPDMLDLPLTQRFFAGGDQSVRGYDYQSIGPVNASGERIGGTRRATGSLEFDWRFADRWLVAAFVDSGSAWDDNASPDFFTGQGAGFRWLSPIGPLRLDFAWGTTLAQPSFNFHFYMGPEL